MSHKTEKQEMISHRSEMYKVIKESLFRLMRVISHNFDLLCKKPSYNTLHVVIGYIYIYRMISWSQFRLFIVILSYYILFCFVT